jgi:hypothetical protein
MDYEEDDGFDFEAPEKFETGGAYLAFGMDGTYHVEITAMDKDPKMSDGSLIPNACLRASLVLLAGTNSVGVKKQFDLVFFRPNYSKGPESVDRDNKKIARFFTSIGLVDPNAPTRDANGQPIKLKIPSIQAAVGRQFIIELESDDYGGKKKMRMAWDHCYHVDDPLVSGVPKDEKSLAAYPAQFRRKPESFLSGKAAHAQAQVSKPANGSTSGGGLPKQAPQTAQAATVTADDL